MNGITEAHAKRITASHALSNAGVVGNSVVFYIAARDATTAGTAIQNNLSTILGAEIKIQVGSITRLPKPKSMAAKHSDQSGERFSVAVQSVDPHKLLQSVLDAGDWRE